MVYKLTKRNKSGVKGARVAMPSRARLGIDKDSKSFYPSSQEFGWKSGGKKHSGQPYLVPALYRNQSSVFNTYKDEMKLLVGKWAYKQEAKAKRIAAKLAKAGKV
jgi:hypothetical protein